MAKNKTIQTEHNVYDFIASYVEEEQKVRDTYHLIELFKKWSGFEPKIWGTSIIGFGSYHYKYASGHEGDAPILAFSPRKAQFSLYIVSKTEKSLELFEHLGKYKMGKVCIYIKKLDDINIETLKAMCLDTILYLNKHHECACRKN